MKEVDLLQKKPAWYKRWWGITLIVFFTIIVLFFIFVASQVYKIYKQRQSGIYVDGGVAPYDMSLFVDPLSASWGADDAKITIVEFGDFNCPRCLEFYSVEKALREKYPDQIKFYWRNYPIVAESSLNFAVAGICAERQGAFWPFHDKLFELQGTISVGDLDSIAQGIGMNVEQFDSCMDNPLSMSQLRKDFYSGEDAVVRGTPTLLINGHKIEGAIDLATLEPIIQKLLTIYESNNTN